MPADPLSLGDPDGYSRYGVPEEQPGGLVCHECGRTFPSLGLHAYRGHGMTAAQYRERHGLQRTAGLITAELRPRIQDNAKAHMASPAGQAFIQHRSHLCQPRLRGGLLSLDEREAPSVLQPQLRNRARAENCTRPDLIPRRE